MIFNFISMFSCCKFLTMECGGVRLLCLLAVLLNIRVLKGTYITQCFVLFSSIWCLGALTKFLNIHSIVAICAAVPRIFICCYFVRDHINQIVASVCLWLCDWLVIVSELVYAFYARIEFEHCTPTFLSVLSTDWFQEHIIFEI